MAKAKGWRRSKLLRALTQNTLRTQKDVPQNAGQPRLQELRSFAEPSGVEPTGSCRYADGLGQMQCESPVTKSDCDAKSGFFTPDARC